MEGGSPLGAFLRARRRSTSLDDVGLPQVGPRRRTPGLRREEVAMLAGISIDYYTRLEQGRERNPSDQVIAALVRVFRLGPEAAEHLQQLARQPAYRPKGAREHDTVHPNVLRIMHGWDIAPAFVVNRRLDVLARNRVADALYEGLEHRDNLLRLALLNPAAHGFYLDWELDTTSKIAHLRATAGRNCDDPFLLELVEELSERSEYFRRMWAQYDVQARTRAPVRFHHREVGDVVTTMEVLSVDGSPGQKLVVFQADAGSAWERALSVLAGRPPPAVRAAQAPATPAAAAERENP
ncbi:helix-turn-helix transcriptional regulator, partial [Microbispora sp. ATCC PTA-5024]|uniref:helix-turn-helix transcriptional regulator n=1 Tax=Microbispora sp. ATCC PTA-5024 TaxID=316330 RepID=UPI000A05E3BE